MHQEVARKKKRACSLSLRQIFGSRKVRNNRAGSWHTLAGMYRNLNACTYLFVVMFDAHVESFRMLLASGLHQILQSHEHAQPFSDLYEGFVVVRTCSRSKNIRWR